MHAVNYILHYIVQLLYRHLAPALGPQSLGPRPWSPSLVPALGPRPWSPPLVPALGPRSWSSLDFNQRQETLDLPYLTLLCDNLKNQMFLQNFFS
jgi:hypothetical protein